MDSLKLNKAATRFAERQSGLSEVLQVCHMLCGSQNSDHNTLSGYNKDFPKPMKTAIRIAKVKGSL